MANLSGVPAKFWYNEHWVEFQLFEGVYQNIITFLDAHSLSFLAEMGLNFESEIPITLHGKKTSVNLLDYLANNSDDGDLILRFIDYFLTTELDMRYQETEFVPAARVNFKLIENAEWQNINLKISAA